jgi:hypothetical protein
MSLTTQRKQTSQAVAALWYNTFFNRHWRAIGTNANSVSTMSQGE